MNLKFRSSIFAKLIVLITVLLVVSLLTLVGVSTKLYVNDSTSLIQALDAETAAHLASDLQEAFATAMDKMRTLGQLALQDEKLFPAKASVMRESFTSDRDFLAFYVHELQPAGFHQLSCLVGQDLEASGDREGSATWSRVMSAPGFKLEEVASGVPRVMPVKLADGSQTLVLSIPFVKSATDPKTFTHIMTLVARESHFTEGFAEKGVLGSYLVDSTGRLVAPAIVGEARAGDSLEHKEIVRELLQGKLGNEEKRYVDVATGEPMLGAFHTVGFGGLGVVTEVPEAKALASVRRVRYDSALIGIAVLALAILVGYFFSNTITWPLKELVKVASRISDGDFDIALKPRTRDEVADLSLAFNEMAVGLKQRDFIRDTMNKCLSREVAEKLLSGEVKLGGEQKEVTIFFSDIRGFTSLSETMEPEAVVEMLNEYMTRMVAVIEKYGGVVNKYVGDAIMAMWGAPLTGPNDPYNAVSACLEMRKELQKLNELRVKRRQPVLLIGMGLNLGRAIAGNIGSSQRVEYTVIGDAVNVASRIESMTKEFGTDLLVSESIVERLDGHFVFDAVRAVQVKGKSRALALHRVLGYIDAMGAPVIVQTPYSSYEASSSEKAVHAA